MHVRAEQQALAKQGLNYVIDELLPRNLEDRTGLLPWQRKRAAGPALI